MHNNHKDAPIVTIVLSDMDRTAEASHGFRSWMLQDMNQAYEVILNLFNDKQPYFEKLSSIRSQHCSVKFRTYPRPAFFNISAANNLGLCESCGEYVIFANSDIIYPSNYLSTVISDLKLRSIYYALGTRLNLTNIQTLELKKANQYDNLRNYDFLVGYENLPNRGNFGCGWSPWIVLRAVAIAIGGFDPSVLCYEDADFNIRVLHYLRRQGLQQCLYAVEDPLGYHISHRPSELYALSSDSDEIWKPRRTRLTLDHNSSEDIVSTNLSSLEALKQDLLQEYRSSETVAKKLTISTFLKKNTLFHRVKLAYTVLKGA